MSDCSLGPTARRFRDGVTGAARERRGVRWTAGSAARARRGEKARHPHGAPRRSGGRVPRPRARDGRAAGRRGLGVPRPCVAARPAESAKPPAEPRADPRRGRGIGGGPSLAALEYAIVRERAGQLGARLRAGERAFHREGGTVELPPRGGEVDALASAWSRVLALATRQREEDIVAPGERYSVEQRTAEIEALVAAQERVSFATLLGDAPTV